MAWVSCSLTLVGVWAALWRRWVQFGVLGVWPRQRRGVLQQSEVLGLEPEPEPESESAIQAVVTTDTTTSRRLSRHSRIAPQNFGYTTCEYCFPLVCRTRLPLLP